MADAPLPERVLANKQAQAFLAKRHPKILKEMLDASQ